MHIRSRVREQSRSYVTYLLYIHLYVYMFIYILDDYTYICMYICIRGVACVLNCDHMPHICCVVLYTCTFSVTYMTIVLMYACIYALEGYASIMQKYVRASPADAPFKGWYLTGTKHFYPDDYDRVKMEHPTMESNSRSTVCWSTAEFKHMCTEPWVNICWEKKSPEHSRKSIIYIYCVRNYNKCPLKKNGSCPKIKKHECYGVATISRLLEIIGLFCRISSLLQGSFAKET